MRDEQQIRSKIADIERYMQPSKRQIRSLKRELRNIVRKSRGLGAKKKGMGVRIGNRSEQLKADRGYKDPSTFVRLDGTEVLHGEDLRKRHLELTERSGGRCEYEEKVDQPNVRFVDFRWRCARPATIRAHVIPRHPKRDDSLSNLKHYCFEHDKVTEKQNWRRTRFGEKKA